MQIIAYLQQHAAPQISSRVPVLPETVADQARLWERDRNRVQQSRAVLYEEFPSQVNTKFSCPIPLWELLTLECIVLLDFSVLGFCSS